VILRSVVFISVFLLSATIAAIQTDVQFDSPQQAALYDRLTEEVRCLVCQNQTIGDSNAPLAADLRRELREQIAAGRSEEEIKTFLTDRYGDFVLYKPRFGGPAMLRWLAPGILLLLGIGLLLRSIRRRAALPVPADEAGTE
jgi:cytochrome c-type biogenesis protein CcmH